MVYKASNSTPTTGLQMLGRAQFPASPKESIELLLGIFKAFHVESQTRDLKFCEGK